MNRTILKLFTQACYHGDYEPENVPNNVVEKFAELIVQECIDTLYKNGCSCIPADRLKEHFGVEE